MEELHEESASLRAPPPLRVTFNGQDFVLFPHSEPSTYLSAQTNEEVAAPRLKADDHVFYESLDTFFDALRVKDSLGDFLEEGTELQITFVDLDLVLREDDIYAREISLNDILRLHLGYSFTSSLHLNISEVSRFITRYNELASAIHAESEEYNQRGREHAGGEETAEEERVEYAAETIPQEESEEQQPNHEAEQGTYGAEEAADEEEGADEGKDEQITQAAEGGIHEEEQEEAAGVRGTPIAEEVTNEEAIKEEEGEAEAETDAATVVEVAQATEEADNVEDEAEADTEDVAVVDEAPTAVEAANEEDEAEAETEHGAAEHDAEDGEMAVHDIQYEAEADDQAGQMSAFSEATFVTVDQTPEEEQGAQLQSGNQEGEDIVDYDEVYQEENGVSEEHGDAEYEEGYQHAEGDENHHLAGQEREEEESYEEDAIPYPNKRSFDDTNQETEYEATIEEDGGSDIKRAKVDV